MYEFSILSHSTSVHTIRALHMRPRFTCNPMMDFHLHCNLFKLVLTFFIIIYLLAINLLCGFTVLLLLPLLHHNQTNKYK